MDRFTPIGYYEMIYYCNNCHSHYNQIFKKGERASQGICTNCGCNPNLNKYKEDF